MEQIIFETTPFEKYLFGNTKLAWLWLIARVYVGYEWFMAGIGKFNNGAWVGDRAGAALTGFINGALAKTVGEHPDVQGWYGAFLQNVVMPHAAGWSYLITFGEMLVGAALILGIFTGLAAFFGAFMNFNFLFAGTVSVNPILVLISIGLILAWKVAGYIGIDQWLLPMLGTPWRPGKIFQNS
jgi:thiosulfate dehydrogenase (quinone) large subunit